MIITETFTAKDSVCDYCNTPLPDGERIALNGYSLVSTTKHGRLSVPGPFVPCDACAVILELPGINAEAILQIHKWVAVQYNIPTKHISIEIDGQ